MLYKNYWCEAWNELSLNDLNKMIIDANQEMKFALRSSYAHGLWTLDMTEKDIDKVTTEETDYLVGILEYKYDILIKTFICEVIPMEAI